MTVVQSHLVEKRSPSAPHVRGRWRKTDVVRAAKDVLFFLYLYCGYVQLRDLILAVLGRSRAVVVYYHRVGGRDTLSKPAGEFSRELDYLKRQFECVGLADLHHRLRAGVPLRRRLVCVTFDDGYRDNYTVAVPRLLAARVPATFFVSTGFVGMNRSFPHDQRDGPSVFHLNLTWADLAQMQAAGFEIGSHTVDHTNLGGADAATVRRQLHESLTTLDRGLGCRPRCFSFPWGKPDDISRNAMDAAREAGYYAVASAYGGCNGRTSDPFHIRRVDVGNGYLSRLAVRARIAGLDLDYARFRLRMLLSSPGRLH